MRSAVVGGAEAWGAVLGDAEVGSDVLGDAVLDQEGKAADVAPGHAAAAPLGSHTCGGFTARAVYRDDFAWEDTRRRLHTREGTTQPLRSPQPRTPPAVSHACAGAGRRVVVQQIDQPTEDVAAGGAGGAGVSLDESDRALHLRRGRHAAVSRVARQLSRQLSRQPSRRRLQGGFRAPPPSRGPRNGDGDGSGSGDGDGDGNGDVTVTGNGNGNGGRTSAQPRSSSRCRSAPAIWDARRCTASSYDAPRSSSCRLSTWRSQSGGDKVAVRTWRLERGG